MAEKIKETRLSVLIAKHSRKSIKMYKLKDFWSSTLFRDMLLSTRTKPVLLKETVLQHFIFERRKFCKCFVLMFSFLNLCISKKREVNTSSETDFMLQFLKYFAIPNLLIAQFHLTLYTVMSQVLWSVLSGRIWQHNIWFHRIKSFCKIWMKIPEWQI